METSIPCVRNFRDCRRSRLLYYMRCRYDNRLTECVFFASFRRSLFAKSLVICSQSTCIDRAPRLRLSVCHVHRLASYIFTSIAHF